MTGISVACLYEVNDSDKVHWDRRCALTIENSNLLSAMQAMSCSTPKISTWVLKSTCLIVFSLPGMILCTASVALCCVASGNKPLVSVTGTRSVKRRLSLCLCLQNESMDLPGFLRCAGFAPCARGNRRSGARSLGYCSAGSWIGARGFFLGWLCFAQGARFADVGWGCGFLGLRHLVCVVLCFGLGLVFAVHLAFFDISLSCL